MKVRICGGKKCCPVIDIKKDAVVIKDDYQGEVKFTPKQWKELKVKIALGEC